MPPFFTTAVPLSTSDEPLEGRRRMSEDEPDVLGMLIRHELAIKELYEIFAAKFMNSQGFWHRLAGDEKRHAEWLGTLRSGSAVDNWTLRASALRLQAIKTSIGYVERQTARAKEGDVSMVQALSIARDLESALLERQFSRLEDWVPKEVRSVLMRLADETRKHLKAVVEVLDSLRGKGS